MYAVIENGVVVNMVVWDGHTAWVPLPGREAIQLQDGSTVSIGWTWDGTNFSPPAA